jgi:hypothetical protein
MAARLLAGGGTGEMGVSKNVCYEGRPYEKNGAKGKKDLRHLPPPLFPATYQICNMPTTTDQNH